MLNILEVGNMATLMLLTSSLSRSRLAIAGGSATEPMFASYNNCGQCRYSFLSALTST